jgi:2-keto-3-deoxy-L-rhamnonate aldolase RhmA
MERTAAAARKAGKFSGCVAPDAAALRMVREFGYRLVAAGSDIQFLRSSAAARLQEMRSAVGADEPPKPADKSRVC